MIKLNLFLSISSIVALVSSLAFLAIFVILLIIVVAKRYIKCPSDKILVVYGRIKKFGNEEFSIKSIHGGAVFVWPILQSYAFLDIHPIPILIEGNDFVYKDGVKTSFSANFTVAISVDPELRNNAAQRLLGLSKEFIAELAESLICECVCTMLERYDYASMESEKERFMNELGQNVESKINQIGLFLINMHIKRSERMID